VDDDTERSCCEPVDRGDHADCYGQLARQAPSVSLASLRIELKPSAFVLVQKALSATDGFADEAPE
jgi:hypothetical protein